MKERRDVRVREAKLLDCRPRKIVPTFTLFLLASLERIEPAQQFRLSPPERRLARPAVHGLERPPFRLQVCLRIMVRGVQVGMSEETSNDRDIHSCGYQMNSRRMPEQVGRDVLVSK